MSPPALYAEDLLSVYRQALQQAPQLRIAEAAAQSAEAGRREARAGLLPSLDLSAGYSTDSTSSFTKPSGPTTTDDYTTNSYALSLSQPLFDTQASAGYRAARNRQAAQQSLYNAARQRLMVEVAAAYFAVLEAEHNLELSQAEQAALGRQLDEMHQRFRVGLTTKAELHETQARFDLAAADLIQADLDLQTRRELLAEYTGTPTGGLRPLTANMALSSPEPDTLSAWEQQALAQHPEYRASRETTAAAEQALKSEQNAHLPTVDLAYEYRYTDTGGNLAREQNTQALGVELNLPLYLGGATSARVAAARADLQRARAEEEQVRRRISREVRQAYMTLKSDINRVRALSRALLSQQEALEATQLGLRVGARSNIDLLNARRELLRARRDYARARYDYLVTRLQLYRAAGVLDESHLETVNRWLQ